MTIEMPHRIESPLIQEEERLKLDYIRIRGLMKGDMVQEL